MLAKPNGGVRIDFFMGVVLIWLEPALRRSIRVSQQNVEPDCYVGHRAGTPMMNSRIVVSAQRREIRRAMLNWLPRNVMTQQVMTAPTAAGLWPPRRVIGVIALVTDRRAAELAPAV